MIKSVLNPWLTSNGVLYHTAPIWFVYSKLVKVMFIGLFGIAADPNKVNCEAVYEI